MAKQVQLRRGTTAQVASFTGAVGEIVYDTDLKTVVAQDGSTAGGFYLALKNNTTLTGNSTLGNATIAGNVALGSALYVNTATSYVGFGTNAPVAQLDITGAVVQDVNTVSASAIDCSTGNYFIKTVGSNLTWTFTNVPAGRMVSVVIELTNAGAYTMTWPASVKWPGGVAPSLTASGVDILAFLTDDSGTTWRGLTVVGDSR
jgi:hypothetical protein